MTSRELTTTRAADLAERLVDQISESDQDWAKIELYARELLELVVEQRSTELRHGLSMPSQSATGT